MESSSHARRKRRLDSPASSEENEIVRSGDIWFNDGNIILQVQNTQFQVHKGILAKHSGRFKEYLDKFQPTNNKLRVVPLTAKGLTVQDATHFLNAIYDSTYLFKIQRDNQRLPISAVTGLIRLGNRYGFQELRDIAVAPLRAEFPRTFDAWVTYDRSWFQHIKVDEEETETALLRLLDLAVECGIQTILPQLYIDIYCHLEWGCILSGIESKDGMHFTLPADVQATCMLGFHSLRDQYPLSTYSWLRKIPYPGCTSGTGKTRKCANGVGNLYLATLGFEERRSGLEPWDKTWGAFLCPTCTAAAQQSHEAGRRELWEKLPSLFDLPGWEDLTDF